MEKSSTDVCLGFYGRAKLLWHAGVGIVQVSEEVEFLGAGSLQPIFQCIKKIGQYELRHADEGRRKWEGAIMTR